VAIVRQRDRGLVFAVYCPHHRSRVLLSADDIENIVNRPTGIDVHWRCPCGGAGVLRTGTEPTATQPEGGDACIPTW
jgi:hypothetical protein